MRTVIVGNHGSRLQGEKARCCGQQTQPGQAVFWHQMDTKTYVSPLFVLHVECMAERIEQAPTGVPVKRAELEVRRIRQRAKQLLAGH